MSLITLDDERMRLTVIDRARRGLPLIHENDDQVLAGLVIDEMIKVGEFLVMSDGPHLDPRLYDSTIPFQAAS